MELTLILFIAHRAASGFRNGMFYVAGRKPNADWLQFRIVSVAAMIALVFFMFAFSPREHLPSWLNFVPRWLHVGMLWGCIAASAFSTVLASAYSYLPGRLKDLHFWTLSEQTFLASGLFIAAPTWDIFVTLACCVYPSVFLQKWIINWSVGKPWYDNETDDPAGRYYTVLGIRIPRFINQKFRLILAISSIFVFIIKTIFK
jgi:hypothetical protein